MSATTRVITTVTNAATKTYSYSGIDLLDETVATLTDQIDVYLTPASTGIQAQLTVTTDFTYATLPTKEITLVGTTATNLAVGDIITIRRSTKDDERYTDFTDLGFLRSEDVNTNGDQLLFLIQENRTDVQDALIKNDSGTKWEGEGLPSTNCASATDSTGWATYGQVLALVTGGDPMDVGEGIYAEANGDNSKTSFEVASFPTTDVSDEKIFVTVNGIVQRPGVDYEYILSGGVPTVNFLAGPPPTGTGNVGFRVIPGIVTSTYDANSIDGSSIVDGTVGTAELEDGSVTTPKLADNAVTAAKINVGSGASDRFLVCNSSGVPTARVLATDDIPVVDMTTDEVNEVFAGSTAFSSESPYVYTNSTGVRCLVHFSIYSFGGSSTGTVTLGFSGGGSKTIFTYGQGAGIEETYNFSIIVPIGGTVTITGISGATSTLRRITEQEF